MGPFIARCLFECSVQIWTEYAGLRTISKGTTGSGDKTCKILVDRHATPHQLAPAAEPLPFWDEWYAVTLLVNCQITPIAKYYSVCVLAVAIVAYGTLGVLFFPLASGLPVDCCCGAGPRTMRLWRFWVRFGNTYIT